MSQVQLPQAVMSTNVETLVEGLVLSALRGVRIFVTSGIKEQFQEMFKELGIEFREYSGTLPDTCIVIRDSVSPQQHVRILVEVYENGKKVNFVSTTLKKFAKVLEYYIRKRRGDVQQLYFEMIIPKDFSKLLESIDKKTEDIYTEDSEEDEDEK